MNPGNSTSALTDAKSVLVPGLTVTRGNPFGLACITAPEPVSQPNTSTLNGTLRKEMSPLFMEPTMDVDEQLETEDINASPIPPKAPKMVTVAVSLGDKVRGTPAALKRDGCGCI